MVTDHRYKIVFITVGAALVAIASYMLFDNNVFVPTENFTCKKEEKTTKKEQDEESASSVYCSGVIIRPFITKKEIPLLKQKARQGDVRAQSRLGDAYCRGLGVVKDEKQALCWFRHAAEQGFATAQVQLGEAYSDEIGVKENLDESFRWNMKAAQQNHPRGQGLVCLDYGNEDFGVEKDLKKAKHWCKKALAQGDVQSILGWIIIYSDSDDNANQYLYSKLGSLIAEKYPLYEPLALIFQLSAGVSQAEINPSTVEKLDKKAQKMLEEIEKKPNYLNGERP